MKHILFSSIPRTHEIIIDEDAMVWRFILRPDLYQFIVGMFGNRKCYYEGLSDFIQPTESSWGYGEVFTDKGVREDLWIIYECLLPKKPSTKKLIEVAASINDLAAIMSIFEPVDDTDGDVHQLLSLEFILPRSNNHFNGGAFSFFYSKEVLDYAATIWHDKGKYQSIIVCMQKTYLHLAGRREANLMRHDFQVGCYQENLRLPTFRCPGNCACISPEQFVDEDDFGVRYVPHNIDTKIQQFTLLAGILKLAEMARAKL